MLTLTSLFSSPAKLKVLRTLAYQTSPLPLRQIAYLSGTPLYSVQRVLDQLTKEKILIKKRKRPFVFFSLNEMSLSFGLLKRLFDLESGVQIAANAGAYDLKAQSLLEFINQALPVLKRGRSWASKRFLKKW